jgi:hypothetical protein
MAKTKFGSFDDLLDITEEPLQPIMLALREMILAIDPDACEVVRLGDRAATYGVGPKKMIEGYTYILPYKSWVNLGFYRGAILEDPNNLLEGTGKNMRHIKIRSLEEVEQEEIRQLIQASLAERREALK